jgi:hypothetical protein
MENLKQRILTNWTLTRVLFVAMGTVVAVSAAYDLQWFGVLFGAYFASMGLFSFGCASGACFGGSCNTEPIVKNQMQDVDFEEVKTK